MKRLSSIKIVIFAIFAILSFLTSQFVQAFTPTPKPDLKNIQYPVAKVATRKVKTGHGYYESFGSVAEVSEYQLVGS